MVLDNIAVARAYTVEHLIWLLTQIAAKMMEDQYALLIVDSIMALFRVDFSGRGELSERQQVLGKVLSKLIKLAEQFNIAVVITNQGYKFFFLLIVYCGSNGKKLCLIPVELWGLSWEIRRNLLEGIF